MEKKDNILNIVKLIRNASSEEEGKKVLLDNYIVLSEDIKQKSLEDFVDRRREEKVKEQKEKEKMRTNPEYIEWLTNFTKKQKGFEDNQWLYFPQRIKEKDRINVENLDGFFGIITDYAKEKEIIETEIMDGYCYYVKYKDTILEVGAYHGEGIVCYASLVLEPVDCDIIDYEEILKMSSKDKNDNKKTLILRPEDEE